MSIADQFLAEYEQQEPITRRFLERLPADKLTWKPHEKSMTAGQLALHLATIPAGILHFVSANPAQAPTSFVAPQPANCGEILKAHDDGVGAVRSMLPGFDDAAMAEAWHLMAGDRELFALPRGAFLRDVMLNHWYQHRGQFSVYLRILDIPVPSSFGPSADEVPPFMRQLMQKA